MRVVLGVCVTERKTVSEVGKLTDDPKGAQGSMQQAAAGPTRKPRRSWGQTVPQLLQRMALGLRLCPESKL